eukprot:TRINITY_DN10886_c0_g2_i2.p1 TRINITY_DN10886_c0_g2~~TRINITY_DN10886_c0_g2_i2.p1  ORF type:complete len:411 (+),score=59.33 TRINITY_DN10886_c0_g2_i2:439-1671(+)
MCEDEEECQAVVHFWAGANTTTYNITQDKQFCYLIKAPTKLLAADELNITRPLEGVSASLCTLSWPINQDDVKEGCIHEPSNVTGQYRYGVTTTFFTCRGLPWSKCGLLGDPHIRTFDRPWADENCPVSKRKRNSGIIGALKCGFFHVIRIGRKTAKGRYLLDVQGKLDNAAGANKNQVEASSMNGLAISGALLDGATFLWEDGRFLLKKSSGEEWDMTDDLNNNKDMEIEIEGIAEGIRTTAILDKSQVLEIGGNCTDQEGCKDVYIFKFYKGKRNRETSYLRVLIAPRGEGSPFGDVIITQQKMRAAQYGLCGNFNGNPADDQKPQDLSRVLEGNVLFQNVTEPDCTFPPVTRNISASRRVAAEGACDVVEASLREQCVFDILALPNNTDSTSIVQNYIIYGALWKYT